MRSARALFIITFVFHGCASMSHYSQSALEFEVERLTVSAHLAQMVGQDQAMRFGLIKLLDKGYKREEIISNPTFQRNFDQLDKKNTEELKEILKKWGWIKISEFGESASHNAWILVQHADYDLPFQEKVLGMLAGELKSGDVTSQDYAYLWDRVCVNKKALQRYGTQGSCTGKHKWTASGVEEPKMLEERRKSMKLDSMSNYIQKASAFCLK